MSTTHTEPGVAERFLAEVERRCAAMKPPIMSHILCVSAGLSYPTWASWTDPKAPSSPTAGSMDLVLAELERQEKMRGKK